MSISIPTGMCRLATLTMKNDDGSPNTSPPTISAPHPSIRASFNPADPTQVAVVGVALNASGANARFIGAAGTFAEQLFTVETPTGLASTSLGVWSAPVAPPSWA